MKIPFSLCLISKFGSRCLKIWKDTFLVATQLRNTSGRTVLRCWQVTLAAILLVSLALLALSLMRRSGDQTSNQSAKPVNDQAKNRSRSPISFEINQGQVDQSVKFMSRGNGYGLFLRSTGAVFAMGKPAAQQHDPKRAKDV